MNHPRIIKVAALAMVSSLYAGVTTAQKTGPDYETTAIWLQSKFNQLGSTASAVKGANKSIRYNFVSMNNCTLIFSLDSTTMDDAGVLLKYSKVTYTIPLGSVSGVHAATGPGDTAEQRDVNIEGAADAFILKTEKFVDAIPRTKQEVKAQKVADAKEKKLEKTTVVDPIATDIVSRTNFAFIQLDRPDVNNLDLAPRVATALSRAVSLCKAQAPVKTEPF